MRPLWKDDKFVMFIRKTTFPRKEISWKNIIEDFPKN